MPTAPIQAPPPDPATMFTPPRNYPAAPVPMETHADQPKSQEEGSLQMRDERTSVEKADSAIVSATIESSDSKKVTTKPRRKPSKAKLAINFGGGN